MGAIAFKTRTKLASILVGTEPAINFTQGAGMAVTVTDDSANGQVTVDLAASSPTPGGNAGGDLTGTYPSPTIAASAVTNAKVAAGAAIAYSKLNLGSSIVSADIVDGTIVAADLANGAATPDKNKTGGTKGQTLQVDSTGSAWKWVNGNAYELPGVISPLGSHPALLANSVISPGANKAVGVRMVAPRDGVISGIAYYQGATAGNLDFAILDTTVTTRNVLYASGSVAASVTTSAWIDTALNPNLTVVAGQQFDVAIAVSSASETLGRMTLAAAGAATLPSGWMTAGVTSGTPAQILCWTASITPGSWGGSLAESSMTGLAYINAIIVKIT